MQIIRVKCERPFTQVSKQKELKYIKQTDIDTRIWVQYNNPGLQRTILIGNNIITRIKIKFKKSKITKKRRNG